MAQRGGKRDPYATLGVARDATADTIKKAYRKQAQKYHPDRNADDPSAEETFKQVSAAYAVLSDPERRRNYDEFGEIALDPNFDAEKARQASAGFGGFPGGGAARGFQDLGGFGNIFEDLFGAGARVRSEPRARRGHDLEVEMTLDFVDAALGSEQRVNLERSGASGSAAHETLTIHVPPGVDEGARIRLAGKGGPGSSGGPPGDLFATVHIRPHRVFRRDGRNLALDAPISVREAVEGATIEIPTLDGRVNLRIPPGTNSGARLRLRGKGVPDRKGKERGDLYVTVQIQVPRDLDEEKRRQLVEILGDEPKDLRANLFG